MGGNALRGMEATSAVCSVGRDCSTPVLSAPPPNRAKCVSGTPYGPIFPVNSKVMREELFTGPGVRRLRRVLSGSIFSEPVDYADMVTSPVRL